MELSPADALTAAYAALFALVAGARWVRGLPGARTLLASVALIALAVVAAPRLPAGGREWLGLVYIAAGYWLPVWLVGEPREGRFARWLTAGDERLRVARWPVPAWIVAVCNLCYLLCYPLVPTGYAVLLAFGSLREQQVFWPATLSAGFICYGTLPWLVSLPPRLKESGQRRGALEGVNLTVLQRVSHGLNTFPSGHAAVSAAVTLALWPVPAAAAIVGVVACGIACGAVLGRHHYVLDVIAGVVVGVTAALAWDPGL